MTTLDDVRLHGSDYPQWIRSAVRLFHNWKTRRNVRALETYDQHMLDDIGVTRDEIHWASHLPLSLNAAWELRHRSRTRRLAERAIGSVRKR